MQNPLPTSVRYGEPHTLPARIRSASLQGMSRDKPDSASDTCFAQDLALPCSCSHSDSLGQCPGDVSGLLPLLIPGRFSRLSCRLSDQAVGMIFSQRNAAGIQTAGLAGTEIKHCKQCPFLGYLEGEILEGIAPEKSHHCVSSLSGVMDNAYCSYVLEEKRLLVRISRA